MNTKKLIAATLAITVLPLSISTLGAQKVDAFTEMPVALQQKITEKVTVDLTSYEEAYEKADKFVFSSFGKYTLASIMRVENELMLRCLILENATQIDIDAATERLDTLRKEAVSLDVARKSLANFDDVYADTNGEWVNSIDVKKLNLLMFPYMAFHGEKYRENEWTRIIDAKNEVEKLLKLSKTVSYDPTQEEVDAIEAELRRAANPWAFDRYDWGPDGYDTCWDVIGYSLDQVLSGEIPYDVYLDFYNKYKVE